MASFKIGTSKVCISPSEDMFPFDGPSYLEAGIKIEGVYFKEYIRVIAIDDGAQKFVIGAFENNNGTDALKERVKNAFGIPWENQIYCQTHNHGSVSSPLTVLRDDGQKSVHSYADNQVRLGKEIFEKSFQAVSEALSCMKSANMGFGEGTSYINVNRDLPNDDGYYSEGQNFNGPSDKTLAVIKFEDEDGNLVAAILNHCTHANTTICATDVDGKMKTSADFPGFTCDYLEKKYPGSVILWTSGAAGDQNALFCYSGKQHYEEISENAGSVSLLPDGFRYHYAQYLGERHAFDAVRVLNKINCSSEPVQIKSAKTDVAIPQQSVPAGVNFWLNINLAQNNVETVARMAPEMVVDRQIVGRHLEDFEFNGNYRDCEVLMFRIGGLAIVSVAAELYNKLGKIIKNTCPWENAVVLAIAGGHGLRCGYIQDTQSNTHKTFQHFGEAYPCDSDKLFADAVRELAEQCK